MTHSLSARLLILLLGLLGLIWLALSYHIQAEASRTAAADIDARLQRAAGLVLAISRQGFDSNAAGAAANIYASSDAHRRPPEVELTTLNNRVLLRSSRFPQDASASHPEPGYTDKEIDGASWRILTVVDDAAGLVCRVGVDNIAQEARRASLLARFNTPVLLALPPLVLIAWASVWFGLRPLLSLTRELERRDALDLEPLQTGARRPPTEIRLLTARLNHLFGRLRRTLAKQRAFISAAGHELRTPIAGLKAQIEVAQRARDDTQRGHALDKLAEGATHIQHLAHELLLLARLDPAAQGIRRDPVNIANVLRRAVAARSGVADQAAMHLEIETQDVWVAGDADLLEALVGNLIDNARRHAPAPSTVSIALTAYERTLSVTVTDRGPGIPVDEREKVFEPFHRLDPGARDGTGLGLAVSRAIAAAHDGEVWIETPAEGGTVVTVRLPAAGLERR